MAGTSPAMTINQTIFEPISLVDRIAKPQHHTARIA
jgi:hypothetical protein